MVLLFLIGALAVGKMTVEQELGILPNFQLLLNHDTIELVSKFFEYDTPRFSKLDAQFLI